MVNDIKDEAGAEEKDKGRKKGGETVRGVRRKRRKVTRQEEGEKTVICYGVSLL